MRIPIVGPSYRARSLNEAADTCINLYPEVSEIDNSVSALYGTPGCRTIAILPGSGEVRGLFVPAIGKMIAVQGDAVYRVDGNMNVVQCTGELLTKTGQVCIAENGIVAVIVDGTNGYVLDLTSNNVSEITDPAFYGADKVGFIDGYFVFNKPGTQQFYISSIYGTNFDALDFASAEGSPDLLISLLVDHREVWMFGDTTTEVFYNSGADDFPIERITGAYLEHGCIAKHSVAKLDNTVFWLGKDTNGSGMVWRANGYSPQRISTHAIEYAIQGYDNISDAIAYTYQQDGHSFYMLTFPTANKTWCYDAATNLWHERAFWNDGDFERHRSNCCAFYAGKHIVGDYENGKLYELDLDYYMDDNLPLVAQRAVPIVTNSRKLLFHRALEIEVETGVGYVPAYPAGEVDPPTPPVPGPTPPTVAYCFATMPSDEQLIRMNTLIDALTVAGVWAKLDSMYVPMRSGELHGATCDWVRPGVHCQLGGSVSWDNTRGFVGYGLNGDYVDTRYTPASDGINFELYDCSVGAFITEASTQLECAYFGSQDTASAAENMQIKRVREYHYATVNASIGSSCFYKSPPDLDLTNTLSIVQRLTTITYLYVNAALPTGSGSFNPRNNPTAAFALPNESAYMLAVNDASVALPDTETPAAASIAMWYAGGALTVGEQTAFYNALMDYLYG